MNGILRVMNSATRFPPPMDHRQGQRRMLHRPRQQWAAALSYVYFDEDTTFLLLFETQQHVSILDTVIFVAEGFKLKFSSGLKCLYAGSMYDSCPR